MNYLGVESGGDFHVQSTSPLSPWLRSHEKGHPTEGGTSVVFVLGPPIRNKQNGTKLVVSVTSMSH
jgi:hypothetical protein